MKERVPVSRSVVDDRDIFQVPAIRHDRFPQLFHERSWRVETIGIGDTLPHSQDGGRVAEFDLRRHISVVPSDHRCNVGDNLPEVGR